MHILLIQCSGRKTGSTALLFEQVKEKAAEAGHRVELVHLRELSFDGCHSCLHCKLNKAPWNETAHCAMRDDLRDVLAKAQEADVMLIGSPIYFGNLSSYAYAFLERLFYPAHVADEARSTLWGKRTPTGYVLTMSADTEAPYKPMVDNILQTSGRVIGPAEALYIVDTDQFVDYDKYYAPKQDAAHKASRRAVLLTEEVERTYQFLEQLMAKVEQ